MRNAPRAEEGWAEFAELWRRFREETEETGSVVLVEGEHDRRSLRALGLRATVVTVHAGRPLAGVARALSGRHGTVIVLTDWDRTGGTLARSLKALLEVEGRRADVEWRRRLARAVRGELVHVEGLARWAHRLAERAGPGRFEELVEPEGPGPTG